MKKLLFSAASLAIGVSAYAAAIEQVIVRQQWPWSTDVKVEYKLSGVTAPVDLTVRAYNGAAELPLPESAVKGDRYGISDDGVGQLTIDPVAAFGTAKIALANFRVKLTVSDSAADIGEVLYKIFDLTNGQVENVTRADLLNGKKEGVVTNYKTLIPSSAQTDVLIWTGVTNNATYMKDKVVMRRVKAGTFTMGSPTDEFNRDTADVETRETQHSVTLSDDYYMGVFEVTQYQYYLITGTWPSKFSLPDCRNERPVEYVSYVDVRGNDKGTTWPTNDTHEVDASSALGLLRAKFGGQYLFDLPTEAQWENACRAGTSTATYYGGTWEKPGSKAWYYDDPELNVIARYERNGGWLAPGDVYACRIGDEGLMASLGITNGTTRVGSYVPNANGLYDMLGNVPEHCLDWFGGYPTTAVTDPKGPAEADAWATGIYHHRVIRGSSYDNRWCEVRSAMRMRNTPVFGWPSANNKAPVYGFRLCLPAE